jgi:hypothetical protein
VALKDSLYSAIGLAAASLEQHLDFNSFLEQTMVPEVQSQQHEYRLLRRRFALVLGQWVPVKPGELNMNAVYQIFQHLLNNSDPLNDLVVRITAGRQLRNVLDPYDFAPGVFLPFAPAILGSLMSLVQEAESPETKMGLLETVRTVVVKLEDNVSCKIDSFIDIQLTSLDCSFLRPNYFSTPTTMGELRRRALNEAGNSNLAVVPHCLP